MNLEEITLVLFRTEQLCESLHLLLKFEVRANPFLLSVTLFYFVYVLYSLGWQQQVIHKLNLHTKVDNLEVCLIVSLKVH